MDRDGLAVAVGVHLGRDVGSLAGLDLPGGRRRGDAAAGHAEAADDQRVFAVVRESEVMDEIRSPRRHAESRETALRNTSPLPPGLSMSKQGAQLEPRCAGTLNPLPSLRWTAADTPISSAAHWCQSSPNRTRLLGDIIGKSGKSRPNLPNRSVQNRKDDAYRYRRVEEIDPHC